MYQFTTTNIINSNLDSNGTTTKFAGSTTALTVTRVGKFLKASIVSVWKRAYTVGVKEVASVVVPTITAGQVARLELDIRLEQSTNSEYANAALYFQKPVVVEVIATGVVDTDGAALVAALSSLKDRFGYAYITATYTAGTDTIAVTAKDNNQRFESVKIYEENSTENSIIDPAYDLKATGTLTLGGRIGFGDDDFMIRSIMLPTAENSRFYGISKEERPIIGGNYTQYTLRYSITKDGTDGIVGAGVSVTNHVFYVKSDLVTAFELALNDDSGLNLDGAGKYFESSGGGIIIITGTTSLANDETSQLTANGAEGDVTWSVDSGTSATVDGDGLVTAHTSIDGDTVVRATDSRGNYDTITITVA